MAGGTEGSNPSHSSRESVSRTDPAVSGFSSGAGRGRTARVNGDFDVVSVSLIDNGGDLVIGDRLYIAPSRVRDLDQINSPLALFAGLANELVARIAQDASRIGRSAFKSPVLCSKRHHNSI